MRRAILAFSVLAVLGTAPAFAQGRDGMIIDVRPRSWLDGGKEVQVGRGLDYVTSSAFGGGPVNGISSRGSESLPRRATKPLFTFPFLGANLNGPNTNR